MLETPHVVSYEMEACRAEAKSRRIKGVVVLPVREIGDVIFADFFRQIFAGVRAQALPIFFNVA
jgi:hypothetical protein